MTPRLRDVQHLFRRCLIDGSESALASCIRSDGIGPSERVEIYRETFVSTLHRALSLTFPAVRRLVGEEFFEGAARIFSLECPPTGANLNGYGGAFPTFLERFAPATHSPYLPDVARLELAVNRALHAEDATAIDVAELARLGQDDEARLSFTAHPSVSVLSSRYPVDAIWRAVLEQDDLAMAEVDLSNGPCHLLVERCRGHVEVSRLDALAWSVASALFDGAALGRVLECNADLDVPSWLAEHLLAGRFTAYTLVDRGVVR